MKSILKGDEPPSLTTFSNAYPDATWDFMRNDTMHSGQQAYLDCRSETITNQKGLCAFCEIDIRDNSPLKCRIEHFHPKSDVNQTQNWALNWQNMLGVCNGGSRTEVDDSGFNYPPIKENLSCDAHKDRMIQQGKLGVDCKGWIINPLQLAAFPSLFLVHKGSGQLSPDPEACLLCEPWSDNQHANVEELVIHTIEMLNLNCDRLTQARLGVIRSIEHNKKRQRQKGLNSEQGLKNLAQRYFRKQWPGFFSTIRFCLGPAAETHLNNIAYQG